MRATTDDRNDETVNDPYALEGRYGTAVARLQMRASELPRNEYERIMQEAIEALQRLTP